MFMDDLQIRSHLTASAAFAAIEAAFRDHGEGKAVVQDRVRVTAGGSSLSMMGAVIPGSGVMGAKIYSTVGGRFTFVITLFSLEDGRCLATLDGNTLTELRTAAVTSVAVARLARPDADALAVFGTGLQARAHLDALLRLRNWTQVFVVGRDGEKAQSLAQEFSGRRSGGDCGPPVSAVPAARALAEADVIVTATRARDPLFPGEAVRPNAFVAAVGSSKPDAREIDGMLLRRASRIVVESKPQALREAGEFVQAGGAFDEGRIEELGSIIASGTPQAGGGITLFKSVGVGLSDVALAHLAYRLAVYRLAALPATESASDPQRLRR